MSPKLRDAYEHIRNEFDRRVTDLSPAEYLEVMEEVESHITCCKDCLRDESPELFE